ARSRHELAEQVRALQAERDALEEESQLARGELAGLAADHAAEAAEARLAREEAARLQEQVRALPTGAAEAAGRHGGELAAVWVDPEQRGWPAAAVPDLQARAAASEAAQRDAEAAAAQLRDEAAAAQAGRNELAARVQALEAECQRLRESE